MYQLNKTNDCNMKNKNIRELLCVHNVGLTWIIQSRGKFKLHFQQQCPIWIQNGPWYNTKICSYFCGYYLKYLFTTAPQDGYALMCYFNA